MSLPLRVLGDRILVQPDEDRNAPELLASGIHVAKTLSAAVLGEDKTFSVQRGTVLAVGRPRHPLKEEAETVARMLENDVNHEDAVAAARLVRDLVRKEPAVSVGDDVLFNHDAGQQLTLDNQRYIILHETELIAVVEPEKELCPTN